MKTGAERGLPATLVLDLRLPRTVSAVCVGGLLAQDALLCLLGEPVNHPDPRRQTAPCCVD